MKIIRVLWGNKINNEIPKIPLLKNEVVYVWGKENNKMLLENNENQCGEVQATFVLAS